MRDSTLRTSRTGARPRRAGALSALKKKRGRKPDSNKAANKRIAQLERELAKTQEELRKARLILEVQGKVAVAPGKPWWRGGEAQSRNFTMEPGG